MAPDAAPVPAPAEGPQTGDAPPSPPPPPPPPPAAPEAASETTTEAEADAAARASMERKERTPDPEFMALSFEARLARQPPIEVGGVRARGAGVRRARARDQTCIDGNRDCAAPRAQITMTVPDSESEAPARGFAATKEVKHLLPFSGLKSGKMLYGARRQLEGNAKHIDLYDGYGIVPRKYEFADSLEKVVTLPFSFEVKVKRSTLVFCAVSVNNDTNVTSAVLFDPSLRSIVERDLETLPKGTASKDNAHFMAAVEGLEVCDHACARARERASRSRAQRRAPPDPPFCARSARALQTWTSERESGNTRAARAAQAAKEKREQKEAELEQARKAAEVKAAAAKARKEQQDAIAAARAREHQSEESESESECEKKSKRSGKRRKKQVEIDSSWSYSKARRRARTTRARAPSRASCAPSCACHVRAPVHARARARALRFASRAWSSLTRPSRAWARPARP